MPKAVQRRRGTAAEHAVFIGLPGEATIVTDDWSFRVHDGGTLGGHKIVAANPIVLPPAVPNQFLGWNASGALATMPIVFPSTGDNNPLSDGGVGDGIHNDSPAIQAAISDIESAGGGRLYLPPGIWKLSARLTCSDVPLSIQGAGKFSTTILVDNADGWLDYSGGQHDGLSVADLTIMAGRVDAASGVGLSATWDASAAGEGEHLLLRNVRFVPLDGYDGGRSWFSAPISLANAGGALLEDVTSSFPGAAGNHVAVTNTSRASGLTLDSCRFTGMDRFLRVRGGQNDILVVGCSGSGNAGGLDVDDSGGSGLAVQGCRFRVDDVPVSISGYEGVTVSGSDLGSMNTSSYSPSLSLAGCRRVSIAGNSFGDATTAGTGVHVAMGATSDFAVSGNNFAGQYTAAVSLTGSTHGLVVGNQARTGVNLVSVSGCTNVHIRDNAAFGLAGDLVAASGTNTGLVIQDNVPPGNAVTRSADGGTINVDGAPDGNVDVIASGAVTVTDIVGGYEGMQVFLTNSTAAQVVFEHNLAKIVCYNWVNTSPMHGGGHVSFKKVNGAWLQMTYGT